MLSNQTSRVYCDIYDIDGAIHSLQNAAISLVDDDRVMESRECFGAALALTIIATVPCKTQADFMAVFMSRLTGEPQKASQWEVATNDQHND